jgi:hypothetical protein
MTTELYWMTLTVFMTALFWVPYVLDRYIVRGFWPALAGTQPEGNGPQSVWAQRAIRAHENAAENLVIFVPKMAVVAYFFARLAHFIVYTSGIPVMRTLTFSVGWAAQIIILLAILGWM